MTMKRKVRTRCPCCSQLLSKPIELADRNMVHLSMQEQALFNIVKANPNGITHTQIHERVFYSNRWGEPCTPQVIPTVARNINRKIDKWGMKIIMTGGPGSTYYLVAL